MKILREKKYMELLGKAVDASRMRVEALDLRAKLNKYALEMETLKKRALDAEVRVKELTDALETLKNAAEKPAGKVGAKPNVSDRKKADVANDRKKADVANVSKPVRKKSVAKKK